MIEELLDPSQSPDGAPDGVSYRSLKTVHRLVRPADLPHTGPVFCLSSSPDDGHMEIPLCG